MNTYKVPGYPVLYTNFDRPPIPDRQFDWSCVDENYDGAPDAGVQFLGHGKTEQQAINDYFDQVDVFTYPNIF